jgi:hypothetical protein
MERKAWVVDFKSGKLFHGVKAGADALVRCVK